MILDFLLSTVILGIAFWGIWLTAYSIEVKKYDMSIYLFLSITLIVSLYITVRLSKSYIQDIKRECVTEDVEQAANTRNDLEFKDVRGATRAIIKNVTT